MKIDVFEREILKKQLKPIHLIMGRGSKVKWFACLDARPQREYDLIVYDSEGKALVLPTYEQELENLNVMPYPGGVTVNGIVPQRDMSLDLFVP